MARRYASWAKHQPRYLREWNYRFNRRWGVGRLDDFLIRRAATRGTINPRRVDPCQLHFDSPDLRRAHFLFDTNQCPWLCEIYDL
jgi:hypothetical protein